MWLLDQWAERHILDAQTKGEFDNLPRQRRTADSR
ncbi:DnaJ-like protein [Klebsiella pneumoniae]|uniref:DnaJ-like protein n=1 Tax=Klebsiella pneumoniae TaxID=573 RepID=A0A377XP34_KLEPN|nr:DnaJ-like protein [Klebsiella pneumoniae]